MRTLIPLLMVVLVACGDSQNTETADDSATSTGQAPDVPAASADGSSAGSAPAGEHPGDVAALRVNVAETMARAEHDATSVEVAHILIAFKGAARSSQSRSKDEAEALTAELLGRALNGEDFDALVKEYSNDPGGGPYTMQTDGSKGFPRQGMAKSFGDVGWRLEVGQIGVAGYDPQKSGFGWHIMKRLQ